jgi:hypothetical protein
VKEFALRSRYAPVRQIGLLASILVLCNVFVASASAAETKTSNARTSRFDAEFSLAVGGFFPYIDSKISLGPSSGGSGQSIDTEKVLGLNDSSASPWINFNWRFFPRHQLQVEWFQLNRDGARTADRPFTIGDTTVNVGASTSSKADLNLGRITYGYSFIRNEKFDLSGLIGVHIATAKTTVSASGSLVINGVPVANGSSTESSSTYTFPLPHVGGEISYKVTQHLTAQFTVLAFALDLGDYSGTLLQVDALASYQFTKHFGFGAGLKYFNLDLEAQSGRVSASYDYEFFGPAVFVYSTF